MANDHIKVSQQGMTNAINRIRKAKEEYSDAVDAIEATIKSLDTVWKGNAQQAMHDRFYDKKPIFDQFELEIEGYVNDMVAYRDDVAQRDQGLAAKINANI